MFVPLKAFILWSDPEDEGQAAGTNERGIIHSLLSGQMRSTADLCKVVTPDKKWSNYSN